MHSSVIPHPLADPESALQFLSALDPDAASFNLRSFPDRKGEASKKEWGQNHDNVTLAAVHELIDEQAARGRGLFVVVNAGGQKKDKIERCRALFLDLDLKDFDNAAACTAAMRAAHEGRQTEGEPLPEGWPHASVVVRSGGGGYHVYWLVDDCPLDQFTAVQEALATRFGGDKSVKDLPHVMRLPGGVHFKSDPVAVKLLRCQPGRRYKLDDLLHRLGVPMPVVAPVVHEARVTDDPSDDPVLAYLREKPEHLKSGGRCDGHAPVDVICPNWREHSQPDGETSTIYMPQGFNARPRGFKCSHGHCTGVKLRDFLVSIGYEKGCPSFNSDDGLACRFIAWLEDRAMFTRDTWHVWTGAYWKPDRTQVELWLKDYAKALAEDTAGEFALKAAAGDAEAKQRMRTVVSLLNVDRQARVLNSAGKTLNADTLTLDTHHDLLCVPNGVVDLQTGTLRPSDPGLRITQCAGVEYTPSAKAPRFEQFLHEVLPDSAERDYLQRWCGYCLTGRVRSDAVAFWVGSGANGKSVLMGVLAQVLGDYAIASRASLLLGNSTAAGAASPEVARLVGKRLCYVNESRVGERLNDEQLKRLASTDKVTARQLYKEEFDFIPTAKVVMLTNNKPIVDDTSDGTWRRIQLLPFDQQFNGPRRDETLGDKLVAELPGILAWCVRGAVEWHSRGLAPPPSVLEAAAAYRSDSDDVSEWLAVRVEEGGFTTTSALLDDYARHVGLRLPPSPKRFNAMLKDRGFKTCRTSAGKGFAMALRPAGSEFV